MDYTVHGILQVRILECVAIPFSREFSQPRDRTQVSHTARKFFTRWAPGKPKNTGVGSLSLLQRVFPTQDSNRDLLHCRWILYQLSYQRSLVFCNSRYILHTFSSLSYLLWWPMITDLCSFMIVWGAMKWSESHSVVSDSLWPHGLYSPWNSPGQNTGVGSLSFLQGIFPTQESNWGLLHCRWILYQLSCQGRSEAFLQMQAEKRVKSRGSF